MPVIEFNEMLLMNAEFLKPFAITLTHDSETAKDLFQETVYKALANKDKYNAGTNIKGWLYTIMRNIFINSYRRNAKLRTTVIDNDENFLLNKSKTITGNEALANITIKEACKALYTLPDIFKKPFLLYVEGYKYHEIAEALDEPLGTVKSRIHFARKLLKEQVKRN